MLVNRIIAEAITTDPEHIAFRNGALYLKGKVVAELPVASMSGTSVPIATLPNIEADRLVIDAYGVERRWVLVIEGTYKGKPKQVVVPLRQGGPQETFTYKVSLPTPLPGWVKPVGITAGVATLLAVAIKSKR